MKKLTTAQWNLVFALPADGKTYNIQDFNASHFAETPIKVEYVIVETKSAKLRRRLVNGKWQTTESI